MKHLAVDCIVHRKAVVAMANLRWCESNVAVGGGMPSAIANELTFVSSCPKEKYLQIAIEGLRSRLPVRLQRLLDVVGNWKMHFTCVFLK